ncbi:CUL2 [Auxenochlorella protothecoides x Auxenochlorella symbiontica]
MGKPDGPIKLEEGWAMMEGGITKLKRVLEGEKTEAFTAQEYMQLYTNIYNMCTQKLPYDHSEQLYARYRTSLQNYIEECVVPSLKDLKGVSLLRTLCRRWQNHTLMVRWMSRIFSYLDRYYVQRHNLNSMNEVGLLVWKEVVHEVIKSRVTDAILELVERERDGEAVDCPLLKNSLATYQEVGMGLLDAYEKDFEAALLQTTAKYYKRKSAGWLETYSTPEFLSMAEACLKAEENRVDAYLHVSTRTKLLSTTETELLKEHSLSLLEKEGSGCAALLRDGKKEDLARMFRLFGRIPKGLEPMAAIFKDFVESEGMSHVRAATEAAVSKQAKEKDAGKAGKDGAAAPEHQFIRVAIDLHDTYSDYVVSYFGSASLFHKALKEAFETFCNKQIGRATVAEAMASFCDSLLRKGSTSEKLTDDEVESLLDRVVKLLAYVSDKDLFAEFYRTKLSKRLLGTHMASEELEKGVLIRLKQQCGTQFTSRMEGMVHDLAHAKDKMEEFVRWQKKRGVTLPVELNATVLTVGFWPTFKKIEPTLPEEMLMAMNQFTQFHEAINNGSRRLTWHHTHGNVLVRATYDKTYELVVTPTQATILALFNDATSLKYIEIQEATNIDSDDLERTLASLVFAKHKLLSKEPMGRTINSTDTFAYNAGFKDRMRRIRVALPPLEDRRKVKEDVGKDRVHIIQATIVRIMKSRRVMKHQELLVEVVGQTQKMFAADVKLVKKQIESLIEREFLERDEKDTAMYKYVA